MRLLNVDSFKLEQFYVDIPAYAILSHTWGKDEVTFDEFPTLERTSPRLRKADRCCQIAKLSGIDYVWIDTFCINKDSSSELSESINSMYRWYERAQICIAYLSDVEGDDVGEGSAFRKSRWFTRGWTLQELIAPPRMVFLDSEWKAIGQRGQGWYGWMRGVDGVVSRDVSKAVHKVTGLRMLNLQFWSPNDMKEATVAEKMSWAAKRQTTRPEDMAYSLLGIFNISMPLLYGEGGERALVRLQEEITKQSHDLTIFAWGFGKGLTKGGIFATSPADFEGCGRAAWWRPKTPARRSHYTVTNLGVQTTARYVTVGERVCYVLLDTVSTGDDVMAIPMTRSEDQDDILERSAGSIPLFVPSDWLAEAQSQQVYLAQYPVLLGPRHRCHMRLCPALRHRHYQIAEVYPPHAVLGGAKDGRCQIIDRGGVTIVRLTNGRPVQFCTGIYKSGGGWRCRMLVCDPTATIAGLLAGAMKDLYARELVQEWDRVVNLDGEDFVAKISKSKDTLPFVESYIVIEMYVPIPSGPG